MANIEEIKNNKAFNQNFVLENAYWKVEILKKNDDYIYRLSNKLNSTLYSDVDYYYGCCLKKGDNVNQLVLESRTLACETNEKLFITGKFLNEEIFFEQVFELKKDSIWLEEKIKIINKSSKEITFSNIDFGFLKRLFSQDIGWFDNLDEFCLSSIPTRRFHGQLIDRRLDSFSANDLVNSPWFEDPEATSKPGFCSEGWLWGDNKTNLLVCKYNLEEIEYSRFNRHSIPVDGRGVEDVAVILGGCFLYKGNPENAAEIKAKENYSFGSTKYAVFEGDYSDGFYLYREHLNEKGHIYLKNYNPPLNWNEIYNLGWIGENFNTIPIKNKSKILPYSLEQLYEEAELAKDIGAQCLYLDPGWETYYGSTIWDSDRLGSLSGFSKKVHDEYGLKIGFQQVMCFLSEKELDNFYFLDKEGSKVKYGGGQFIPLFHFCANNFWISEKTKRL
ncbi:MAG: hypothetical protein M1308_08880, partial [Actinobacteria bacterium]|nr:hypothetical protein [Actinomycetota bacterium]